MGVGELAKPVMEEFSEEWQDGKIAKLMQHVQQELWFKKEEKYK